MLRARTIARMDGRVEVSGIVRLVSDAGENPCEVVVDVSTGAPMILHWGAPLGEVDLATLGRALDRPTTNGALDVVAPLTVVPEHGSGFPGRPGLLGHRRRGTAWAPRFTTTSVETVEADGSGSTDSVVWHDGRQVRPWARAVTVTSRDEVAELELVVTIELDHVLRVRATLTNQSADRYLLDRLAVSLPVPSHATELLGFTGRWIRELHPVRQSWGHGTVVSEDRRGTTSHEHPPLLFVGEPGFGEWHGEVWGVHLAWSGNHELAAECLPDGRRHIQVGELLHPGELSLDPGESYTTPDVVGVWSESGLTRASWGFHDALRAQPGHADWARPVLLNTWEAVYFDHDEAVLRELASSAAALGVERFVLDDGWFGSRRDDTRGLGDWEVSPERYPNGLGPLIAHVRSLGMEFGIWVEPEMVNPDSDLYRAHPDWALATPGYPHVLGRHQLVLDLGHPDAYAHVAAGMHALLGGHDISFVKWDMNRNHVGGSGAGGAAGTHAQTLAVYRLLDELRAAHPHVAFESCSSGGGRIDHGVLTRTQRVWTSDCNDPLERQTIQRSLSMFVPPELMGAHIGPPRAHTTGRTATLAFRAATAMFGHLGVEWNVLSLDVRQRRELADMIELHRRFRPLLHTGRVVRFDPVLNGTEAVSHAHGVYSADGCEALVAAVQLRTGMSLTPPALRLPGLVPDARYRVAEVPLPPQFHAPAKTRPSWMSGITLTGRQLAKHGLQLPVMHPETVLLLHLSQGSSDS
jgi:alpha-galactosidase